jgi:ABC-type transport system involved in multi-copper enzyme maturation permease subunit
VVKKVLNLMKLEIKKHKVLGYFKGVAVANIVILALICLLCFVAGIEMEEEVIPLDEGYGPILSQINITSRTIFIIFASVLIGRLIIEEYKTKTMDLMFMYPISRKKIITAKLLVVCGFTLISIIATNIIVGISFYIVNQFLNFIPDPLTLKDLSKHALYVIAGTIATMGLSLIPLYFGMRKKSVATTIVTAFILVSINNTSGANLYVAIAIPTIFAVTGIIIAYQSFRKIEQVDMV